MVVRNRLRRLHPYFEKLSIAEMARGLNRVPLHPGAARYLKARGI